MGNRKWETFFTLPGEKALFWSYHKWAWGLWEMITVSRNLTSDMRWKNAFMWTTAKPRVLLITDLALPSKAGHLVHFRLKHYTSELLHHKNLPQYLYIQPSCMSIIVKFTQIVIENQIIHFRCYDRTFHWQTSKQILDIKEANFLFPLSSISEEM